MNHKQILIEFFEYEFKSRLYADKITASTSVSSQIYFIYKSNISFPTNIKEPKLSFIDASRFIYNDSNSVTIFFYKFNLDTVFYHKHFFSYNPKLCSFFLSLLIEIGKHYSDHILEILRNHVNKYHSAKTIGMKEYAENFLPNKEDKNFISISQGEIHNELLVGYTILKNLKEIPEDAQTKIFSNLEMVAFKMIMFIKIELSKAIENKYLDHHMSSKGMRFWDVIQKKIITNEMPINSASNFEKYIGLSGVKSIMLPELIKYNERLNADVSGMIISERMNWLNDFLKLKKIHSNTVVN